MKFYPLRNIGNTRSFFGDFSRQFFKVFCLIEYGYFYFPVNTQKTEHCSHLVGKFPSTFRIVISVDELLFLLMKMFPLFNQILINFDFIHSSSPMETKVKPFPQHNTYPVFHFALNISLKYTE